MVAILVVNPVAQIAIVAVVVVIDPVAPLLINHLPTAKDQRPEIRDWTTRQNRNCRTDTKNLRLKIRKQLAAPTAWWPPQMGPADIHIELFGFLSFA